MKGEDSRGEGATGEGSLPGEARWDGGCGGKAQVTQCALPTPAAFISGVLEVAAGFVPFHNHEPGLVGAGGFCFGIRLD